MDVSVDEEAIEIAPFPNGTVPKDPVTQSNAQTQSTETIAAAPATAPTMPQALLNGGKSTWFLHFSNTCLMIVTSTRWGSSESDDVLVLRGVLYWPPRRSTKGQDGGEQ
jgi:hypothetical protein